MVSSGHEVKMPLRWSTERKIVLGFGSVLLALCIVAGTSVWLTLALLADLNTVAQQNEILAHISQANAMAAQLATHARLYAVNHDEKSYIEWETAGKDFQSKLHDIEIATNDSSTQVERMNHIRRMLDEKIRMTGRDAAPQQLEEAWGIVNGISKMRPITDELIAMSVEERNILGAKNDAALHAANAALLTIGIAGLLTLVTIGGALRMILHDLHIRRRAEEELERARQVAESASIAKSAFLANMSHELRTPLASIMGYVDLLLDPGAAAAGRVDHLQMIRRSGEHLLALINDILDVSKIEAGRMVVETVECGVVDILAEIDSLMGSRAAEKGITFAVEYLTPLPYRVRTDPTRFRQILMNLAGNAVKFTDAGGVRIVVHGKDDTATGEKAGHVFRIVIEVIDTGVGISPEQQRLLFQPFTQADISTTRRFGGTGLGLSISRRLAHMLEGELSVHSEAGHGSNFRLSFPVEVVPGTPMLAPHEAVKGDIGGGQRPDLRPRDLNLRVLLAEDGVENRDVIMLHVRRAGCHVVAVEDGKQAVDLACRAWRGGEPFHIILMDMQMPVMDGYTATTLLRAEGYSGVIIALTAHAMKEDRDRCLEVGCDEYVSKPIDVPRLLNMMARFTGRLSAASAKGRLLEDPALRQLIHKFCDGLSASVQNLRDLAARQAWNDLAVAAHRLAGAGGAYGFDDITCDAKALERVAREAKAVDVQTALEQLAATAARAQPPQKSPSGSAVLVSAGSANSLQSPDPPKKS
jgi:signal transduction histidine kinase/CheY-like chemotaxis protein